MGADQARATEAGLLVRWISAGLAGLALVVALHASTSSPPQASSPSAGPAEFVHDHTPHHGGVVGMVGDRHVEALALADGTIRAYLTDRWRVPLSLDDVNGTVTVGEGSGAATLELGRDGQRLQARTSPPTTPTLPAVFDLHVASERVSIDFVLPVGASGGGAVGVPLQGCVAPTAGATEPGAQARKLRCTLSFATEVTALGVTADGHRLLLSAVDVGTSIWRLPEITLERGLDQPPPLVMPAPEAPHREAANAIVASPDSSRAVLALEGRLILYSLADGKVLKELGRGRGVVRDVDWSSDGSRLVVSRFYERAATLVDATDGTLLHELAVADEVAAVALSGDARLAAVGTRRGKVVVFDALGGKALRMLDAGERAIEALAFLAPPGSTEASRIVSAGADGALRIFDSKSGALLTSVALEAPLYRLAVAPDGQTFASGDRAGRVRVHDRDGKVLATLSGPLEGGSVLDLAFAGASVVASDSLGAVTVYDPIAR